jgi:hypothetical protein
MMTKVIGPFRISMQNALLVIVVLGSLSLTATETSAQCSCAPKYIDITARDEFNLAYAVFVGKVVDIKKSAPDTRGHYIETVTFEVTRAWKHDISSNLIIVNQIVGCLNGFEKNEEWLVYAHKNQDGTLGSYCCCTRTRVLAKADDDLKIFANDPPTKILSPQDPKP